MSDESNAKVHIGSGSANARSGGAAESAGAGDSGPEAAGRRAEDSGGWGGRARFEFLAEQLRHAGREFADGVLKAVPPDVTAHLNNSRKELLLAAKAMIDRELESIDRCTSRAQKLHEEPQEAPPESR